MSVRRGGVRGLMTPWPAKVCHVTYVHTVMNNCKLICMELGKTPKIDFISKDGIHMGVMASLVDPVVTWLTWRRRSRWSGFTVQGNCCIGPKFLFSFTDHCSHFFASIEMANLVEVFKKTNSSDHPHVVPHFDPDIEDIICPCPVKSDNYYNCCLFR